MTDITDHPSDLPEQESSSHPIAVLCDVEPGTEAGTDWEEVDRRLFQAIAKLMDECTT